jgi:hypothetical protein
MPLLTFPSLPQVGYLVMMSTGLATQPYGLAVILAAYSFAFGFMARSQLKYLVVLTLITFDAMVLCQYQGCCQATGSLAYFLNRVVSVVIGAVAPVLVTNIVLPWWVACSGRGWRNVWRIACSAKHNSHCALCRT